MAGDPPAATGAASSGTTTTTANNNTNAAPPSIAEYKKSQQRVRELIEKRRMVERKLSQVEDGIAAKETAYLESTPGGNIITGFDNYLKGQSGAAAQRRKAGPLENNRVFSKSSISYKPNPDGTPGSTPASHAPTPVSGSFKGDNSGTGTPTGGGNKKKKKEAEDSEAETAGNKKRTNFGASRK